MKGLLLLMQSAPRGAMRMTTEAYANRGVKHRNNGGRPVVSPEDVDRWSRMAAQGMTHMGIAEEDASGFSSTAVGRHLKLRQSKR